ncbi:hypothetical protein NA57DRAFT_70020 [Rhizodiscina lignyota]|uniref:Uncharacterized protein n=1 Tax=Rhizodiscina lignyota TaxID=1504668 RepID=A0A9P4MAL6_9PEZI|nr:hypothetical protein NA57DRAFT_70020 [Rhizodiscina lignyota]
MGRTSKFSFSLSGRKGSAAKEPEEHHDVPQWVPAAPSASNMNMSKVERLLGASSLPVRSSPSYNSSERASLNTKPSYMTLTVSEASADYSDHGMTASTAPAQHYRASRGYQSLRHRASSNLLGLSGDHDAPVASSASIDTRDLRAEHSSSTLRSYYDAQKSPLLVSQQTSASAVRDMALRKGMHQVIPLDHDARQDARNMVPESAETSRTASVASTAKQKKPGRLDFSRLFPRPRTSSHNLHGNNDVVKSPDQISVASEHFPPPPPPPMLSPQERPPSRKSNKSSAEPPQSRRNSKATTADRRQSRRSSKAASLLLMKARPESSIRHAKTMSTASSVRSQPYENPKNNVHRPPPGIQNWFDGLLEEEDEDDLEGADEREVEKQPSAPPQTSLDDHDSDESEARDTLPDYEKPPPRDIQPNSLLSHPSLRLISEIPKPSPASVQQPRPTTPRKSSMHSSGQRSRANTSEDNQTTSEQRSVEQRSVEQRSVEQRSIEQRSVEQRSVEQRSPPRLKAQAPPRAISNKAHRHSMMSHTTATTVTSAGSKNSKLADLDLHNSSALSLSSSDEEGDGDLSLPAIRDSINISDLPTENILIGKARAFEVKPKKRPNEPIRVPSTPVESNSTNIIAVRGSDSEESIASEPKSAGPRTERNEQALREFSATHTDGARETPRPHTSGAHMPTRKDRTASPSSGSQKRRSLRSEVTEAASFGHGHKLMAVTPEEEALLEMMRTKRAAMAKHNFKEGYKLAKKQEGKKKEKVSRPPSLHADAVLANMAHAILSSGPNSADPPQDAKDADAVVTVNSTFGEIIDAFPTPSPTSNRFSTTYLPRTEERSGSPGLSVASSSRRGRSKRHSNLSTMSSNVQSMSGTSATSSSPIPNADSSEAESIALLEGSVSEHVSNASTVKRKPGFDRLSLTPMDISIGSLERERSGSVAQQSSTSSPEDEKTQESQRQSSEEIIIEATESVVAENDTDDSEELRQELNLLSPLLPDEETPVPSNDEHLKVAKTRRRTSMRINVDPEPPSAAPGSPLPSPRLPPSPRRSHTPKSNKRLSTEYRLIPKITPSPVSPSFPPMATNLEDSDPTTSPTPVQNTSRTMSVPTLLQSSLSDQSSEGSSGRPRLVSANSAPAPVLGRTTPTSTPSGASSSSSTIQRVKPRTINIANVKKAFSVARDPSPMSAPLPRRSGSRDRREKKAKSRQSFQGIDREPAIAGAKMESGEGTDRCSVSEDVLAAWGSLGGWRGFDTVGVAAGSDGN